MNTTPWGMRFDDFGLPGSIGRHIRATDFELQDHWGHGNRCSLFKEGDLTILLIHNGTQTQ